MREQKMAHGITAKPSLAAWLRSILSIRARLLLIAIIAIAPLIGERIRGLEIGRTDRLRMASQQTLDLAQNGAEAQEQILNAAQAIMQIVASDQSVRTAPSESCNRRLMEIAEYANSIDALSIATTSGQIICASRRQAVGLDVSDRGYFKQAFSDRSFAVSDFLIGRVVGRPIIVAASPRLASDGSVDGVIIALLDLQWIDRVQARLMQRSHSTAFIVDGTGAVITHSDGENLVTRNVGDHPLIRQVLSQPSGTVVAEGLDGERRIFGYTSLRGTNARLVVGIDEKELLRNINRQVSIALTVVASVTLAILLAVWIVGEYMIVRPIRTLVDKAVRFGRGEFGLDQKRIQPPAEFMPLDQALDNMARQLAMWERDLTKANKRLDRLAMVDELTGLGNRRWFDARLHDEWHARAGGEEPIALIIIDVDHFKRYNDRYGHLQGDACLQAVARTVASVARRASDAARYGGEEFAVLLPGLDLDAAFTVAESIRTAVENLTMEHADSPHHRVTISLGVAASLVVEDKEPEHLVESADAALYRAKRRGRNVTETEASAQISLAV